MNRPDLQNIEDAVDGFAGSAHDEARAPANHQRDCLERAGHVSCKEAYEIAGRYNASHFGSHRDMGECARYTIPADPRRDDDIRLDAFVARVEMMERDAELLAKIRAHPDFDTMLQELLGAFDANEDDVSGLLVELLKPGGG